MSIQGFFLDLYLECSKSHINSDHLTGTYEIWKRIFGWISDYRPKKIAIYQMLGRIIDTPFQIHNRKFTELEEIILDDDVVGLQQYMTKFYNNKSLGALILSKSAEFGSPSCF